MATNPKSDNAEPDKPLIHTVRHGSEDIGEITDVNPIEIDTDEECIEIIQELMALTNLSKVETKLLKKCMRVAEADSETEVPFGPVEIYQLLGMALNHSAQSSQIMAVSNHLFQSVGIEGVMPKNALLNAADVFGKLGSMAPGGEDNKESDINEDPIALPEYDSSEDNSIGSNEYDEDEEEEDDEKEEEKKEEPTTEEKKDEKKDEEKKE